MNLQLELMTATLGMVHRKEAHCRLVRITISSILEMVTNPSRERYQLFLISEGMMRLAITWFHLYLAV